MGIANARGLANMIYAETPHTVGSLPSVSRETQAEARHLQTCLVALERIMAIAGQGTAIYQLAQNATLNRPVQAGGGDY